jgi:hypothetical protein
MIIAYNNKTEILLNTYKKQTSQNLSCLLLAIFLFSESFNSYLQTLIL